MTFDPDDPRLTAYALGELEGDERATVEALLAENPDARRFVSETRALGDLLSEQFRSEPSPGLADEHKAAIETELSRPAPTEPAGAVVPFRPLSSRVLRYSLAATVLIAFGAGTLALLRQSQHLADRMPADVAAAKTDPKPEATVALAPDPAAAAETAEAAPAARPFAYESRVEGFARNPRNQPSTNDLRGVTTFNGSGAVAGPSSASAAAGMPGRPPMSSPAAVSAGGAMGGMGMGYMGRMSGAAATSPPPPDSARSALALRDEAGAARGRQEAVAERLSELDSYNTQLPPRSVYRNIQAGDAKPLREAEQAQGLGVQPRSGAGQASGKRVELAVTEQGNLEQQKGLATRGGQQPAGGRQQSGGQQVGNQGQKSSQSRQLFAYAVPKPGQAGQQQAAAGKPNAGQNAAGDKKAGEAKFGSIDFALDPSASAPQGPGQQAQGQQGQQGQQGGQQNQQGRGQQGQSGPDAGGQSQGQSGPPQAPMLALKQEFAIDSNALAKDITDGTSKTIVVPPPAAEPEAIVPALEQAQPIGNERFTPIVENPFEAVTPENPLSTFSIDVDTAGYANVRRYLTQNLWPPADAVRIEEMVNYFDYDYAPPSATDDVPFAVHTEVVRCPWNPDNRLLRIGLKGQEIDFAQRKPSNLVFLVDVSGSMNQPNKLPLVKAGLRMLVEQLGENDKIALVVYAGNSGLALPSTRGDQKETVLSAIDRLTPGGSTHGSAGLVLAYQIAVENFVQGGINRVILATDGDFNVGVTGPDAVSALAAEKAKTGVFLNVLGVGDGNLKDETMEKIADKGNGTYNYLDTLLEARKVLVEQVGGTLVTIAKDVKIQVEFNPAKVAMFRLVGYENRLLADADFADDTKDAGEIGSGHTVTALYELVPRMTPEQVAQLKVDVPAPAVGQRYVKPAEVKDEAKTSHELLTVHLRYKAPEGHKSTPIDHPVPDNVKDLGRASADTKFAAAVAEFGMLLRGSRFVGQGNLNAVLELARANLGPDPSGRRHEFADLVEKARILRGQ